MENLTKTELQRMTESANKKKFSVHIREEGKVIGIETKNYMVYWFDVRESGMLLFKYAYNTNSGRYREGARMGLNFIDKMIY
jgi:hypothetical protein